MLEIVNVNDITNVNTTLESLSQIHYDKIRNGKVRAEFLNLNRPEVESLYTEQQRAFLISYM
jgi:hypothetical protein